MARLAILALVLCLLTIASTTDIQAGSIEFFSDDDCTKSLLTKPNNIPRDQCLLASPDQPGRAFLVKEKPYCADGTRPSLLLYQDCGCTDGVANYIPNARYGDYGNGSCTPLLGGDFVMFVLDCGEFKRPIRSRIEFSATFPSDSTSTRQACSMGSTSATATGGNTAAETTSASGSGVGGMITGMTGNVGSSGAQQTTASTTTSGGSSGSGFEVGVAVSLVFAALGLIVL
ncbi:hypothetical protein VFPPC_00725 [Pochonia chlamydosporia 170]|uniref:SSCRP protein n=1 Tax=Pochonia chlamydosporia 170 TaxID=1380566 RepID=A0A179G5S2_METCM|nr:hypothetical protein VFPPC_00725 [Pochonia chlamydosporia 170]OAQ72870.2 hypothetical protein VFPPC_00725 [Pochonia chlamydosporia 170]